jgi:hypothetical protein
MDAYLDELFDELVPAEPHDAWNDVLHRARRSRRRYALTAAAVGALVLTPATWAAVNAFEGTPAPPSIQQNFAEWNHHMVTVDPVSGFVKDAPGADVSKVHGVLQLQTDDGPLDLWAAPELDGSGTCWFVGWESEITASAAIGYATCTQSNEPAIDPSTYNEAAHPAYTVVVGSTTGSETSLDVTLTDGQTTTLPVTEHLFLGAVPSGSDLASITGRDADGNVVATWTAPTS